MEKTKLSILVKIFLSLFLVWFSVSSFDLFTQKSLGLVRSKPLPNRYRSDEFVFLRTFYLVEEGVNYYSAFNNAVRSDSRGGYLAKDVFAWRLPTVFYFWSFFVNTGFGIGILFIVLSSASLYCVYKITQNILSPIFLAPYYLDAYYYETSFLFTEWWGLFFFIFGLTTLIYKRNNLTIFFLALSILTRELFIIPVLLMATVSFLLKTNRLLFIKIFFIFLVFYGVHYALVQNQDVITVVKSPLSRIHEFDFRQFQRELAFSMRQYPLLNLRLPLVLAILTPLILVIKILMTKKIKYLYLLSAVSLLFITPFSGVIYNDYWGITFMPLIIALSPIGLSVLKYSNEK